MQVKDKLGEEFEFELMEQGGSEQKEITKKICELWEHVDEKLMQDYLSTTHSPDGLPKTFVMKKGSSIVAFCCLLRNDVRYRSDITPWFGNCFVHENYRHRGLMNLMQEWVCAEAKKLGYQTIYLWTTNKALYIQSGWTYLEEILVDESETASLFCKKLF